MSAYTPTRLATAERLIHECASSFTRARGSAPANEQFFSIADLVITLSFASDTAPPHLVPALHHRASSRGEISNLTIQIWDDTSQTGNLPHLPWNGELMTRRGDIQGFGTETIHATLDRGPQILSVADTSRSTGYYFVRDLTRFPLSETAAPLRPVLFWLLRSHGRFLVHAGAVGDDRGAVLLAGKGGSGKSTTALACLDSDLYYLADDYCLVSGHGRAFVWNLYNSAKATPTTLSLLPFLRRYITSDTPRVNDKAVLFLDRLMPHKIPSGRPLKAIVLPRVIQASEPRLVPAPSDAAASALAISTLVQLPDAGSETLAAIQNLTTQVPCYYLELGSNTRAIPDLLQGLLASL